MKKILFIITLFLFCVGICCLHPVPDNDLWARLIAGAHIVEKLSILKSDFLSYTPTHPWYDHEWGASVFFYLALKYFGDSGFILLKGILAAITLLIAYKTIELRKPQSTVPYNILYYVFMFLAIKSCLGNTVRCLMFTCVFFALSMYLLERSRINDDKRCLLFIPLTIIFWSNIHGGCMSAIGILCIYTVGEFLNKKTYKEYIFTLICSLAALLVNSYGFEYVKFLFSAAAMDRSYISEWVNSFHPKFMRDYLYYKFYLVGMLFVQLLYILKNKINYQKLDKTKILVILAMAYLSITHVRHQFFFIYAAGIFLYDEFYTLFNELIYFVRKKINFEDKEMIKNFCLFKDVVIYLILFIIALPPAFAKNKQITITDTAYPRFAVEFVKINNLTGNLFINFDFGSYAAYKLYPHNLIVMDGRYEEVYNPELLMDLYRFHLLEGDWYKIIRDYKTDVMIIEKRYPVYNKILENPDWALVFENNLSGVFVPSKTVKEQYLYPIPDDDYYNQTKFDTDIKF